MVKGVDKTPFLVYTILTIKKGSKKMIIVKIIIMVFVIGGFLGSLYRGIEKDNWTGFWHNFTLFVLKLAKFICFKEEHPANIYFISVTLCVSKLNKFKEFKNRQPENI